MTTFPPEGKWIDNIINTFMLDMGEVGTGYYSISSSICAEW